MTCKKEKRCVDCKLKIYEKKDCKIIQSDTHTQMELNNR